MHSTLYNLNCELHWTTYLTWSACGQSRTNWGLDSVGFVVSQTDLIVLFSECALPFFLNDYNLLHYGVYLIHFYICLHYSIHHSGPGSFSFTWKVAEILLWAGHLVLEQTGCPEKVLCVTSGARCPRLMTFRGLLSSPRSRSVLVSFKTALLLVHYHESLCTLSVHPLCNVVQRG